MIANIYSEHIFDYLLTCSITAGIITIIKQMFGTYIQNMHSLSRGNGNTVDSVFAYMNMDIRTGHIRIGQIGIGRGELVMSAAIIDFADYQNGMASVRNQAYTARRMALSVENGYRKSAAHHAERMGTVRILLLITFAAVVFFLFISSKSVSAVDRQMYKYYTVVEADQGDSLWSIAEDHMSPGYQDCNELIDEMASINHLNSTHIEAGQKIVVPYFSTEYKE